MGGGRFSGREGRGLYPGFYDVTTSSRRFSTVVNYFGTFWNEEIFLHWKEKLKMIKSS